MLLTPRVNRRPHQVWQAAKGILRSPLAKPLKGLSSRPLLRLGPISGPARMRRGRRPPQSPAPGFGEKYSSLSGFPSHSLESGGGAFLTVIFGQLFAYSAFSDCHFQGPPSVSSLIGAAADSRPI